MVQVLKSGPNPNLANEHGNTPLHYAAFWNYIGICEVRERERERETARQRQRQRQRQRKLYFDLLGVSKTRSTNINGKQTWRHSLY